MPSSTVQTVSVLGAWQPLLSTMGAWLVTSDDNYAFCWGTAAPADAIPGHFEMARRNIRVECLAGETFYVRVLRPTRFTVTPEV